MTDAQKEQLRVTFSLGLAGAAIILTGLALYLVAPPLAEIRKTDVAHPYALALILGGWAVLPPTWFLFEWAVLRPSDPEGAAAKAMIRSQELAGKIWLAGLAVLALLYGVKVG